MTGAARFIDLARERIAALEETSELWDLHRRINDAEHLILSDLFSEQEESELLNNKEMHTLIKRSQSIFCRFESMLEKSFAQYIFTTDCDIVNSRDNITQNYLQRYRTLARREIDLASISSEDRVLFIGSGPLPITAIEYVGQVGCSVECVEHIPEACSISSKVIDRLGLGEHLRVHCGKGQEFDVSSYSVILVAVLAEPKGEILSRIDHYADSNCKLLCRTTTGLRTLIYPQTAPINLIRLKPRRLSIARGDQVISTQLMTTALS